MDRRKEARRVGALFGQGIGDALGVRDEFRPASQIAKSDRNRLIYVASSRKGVPEFEAGDWSDDTEQAVCLLEAYIEDGGQLVGTTVARRFQEWLAGDGRGCGSHTMLCLNDGLFALDPYAVSEAAWENSGRYTAANGAVMRCSVIGTLRPDDLDWTERVAARQARITHFDPRCVASSVAVAVAVAHLIAGNAPTKAFFQAWKRSEKYHPEAINYMRMSLADLKLDEGLVEGKWNTKAPIGYTYKALGAGFWALRNSVSTMSFTESLDPILAAGGDVDSNACVAGALLGAYLGIHNIPAPLVHGLKGKDKLVRLADQIRVLEGA